MPEDGPATPALASSFRPPGNNPTTIKFYLNDTIRLDCGWISAGGPVRNEEARAGGPKGLEGAGPGWVADAGHVL